jgi:hypothetical protein
VSGFLGLPDLLTLNPFALAADGLGHASLVERPAKLNRIQLRKEKNV